MANTVLEVDDPYAAAKSAYHALCRLYLPLDYAVMRQGKR